MIMRTMLLTGLAVARDAFGRSNLRKPPYSSFLMGENDLR